MRQSLSSAVWTALPTAEFAEATRLEAVDRYDVLDSPNDEAFDRLARLIQNICCRIQTMPQRSKLRTSSVANWNGSIIQRGARGLSLPPVLASRIWIQKPRTSTRFWPMLTPPFMRPRRQDEIGPWGGEAVSARRSQCPAEC